MAVIAVQDIVRTGIVPTAGSVVSGDTFLNNGRVVIQVINGGGSSITASVAPYRTVDGQTIAARSVTIAAGETKLIGPFPPDIYNDPSTGMAALTLSGVSSVTVAALRLS